MPPDPPTVERLTAPEAEARQRRAAGALAAAGVRPGDRVAFSLEKHPDAVADALAVVPRSHPFEQISELAAITVPTAVVASDDHADPGHPRAVGEAYAAAIGRARLITDEPGRSPIAWQGSQLSKVIAEIAGEAQA